MEKFAERYCVQNPSIFSTADAAFILAFAVIMLNTDLHNPAIKEERRMTKDAFIRMNRGICEGDDLPDELLMSIFDRIQTNPISLKEDDEARARAGGTSNSGAAGAPGLSPGVIFGNHYDEMERTRESNYLKERDQILRRTELLFKRKRRSKRRSTSARLSNKAHSKFVRTQDTGLRDEYVTPMFDVTWGVCLAVFSTALESANGTASLSAMAKFSEEEMDMALDNAMETTEVCLASIRLAICTSGLCGNDTARGAFIHALNNFTLLDTGKLMEHRHVRCIQALLKLGHEDGELLGEAWEHVFKALSAVSRLGQVYETVARNERVEMKREMRVLKDMAGEDISDDSDSDDEDSIDLETKDMDRRSIDAANSLSLHEAIPESYVDGIFQRSSSLSPRSVKDFILQLCRVSRMEISGYGGQVGSRANQIDFDDSQQRNNQPIIYSLQKLVEVAHYNMDSRPRLIFADLWSTIAGHLTSTALHPNPAVAMYAVDSFRQLSIHFLQKEELGVFEFQKRFLKPFEAVMKDSEYVTTKELLLSCVEQIILRFGNHKKQQQAMLRSGWRPVLTVLGLTGHDEDDSIANAGFKMLNDQLEQCLAQKDLRTSGINGDENSASTISLVTEHFVTLVDALVIFVAGKRIQMSLKAIDHLIELSTLIADGAIPLPTSRKRTFGAKTESDEKEDTEEPQKPLELQLWWPILLGLSQSIGDKRRAVREKALRSLLDLVKTFFLTCTNIEDMKNGFVTEEAKQYHLQTLQLIFRGIFIPTLEYAETDMGEMSAHPKGFPHFITKESLQRPATSNEESSPYEDLLVNDDDMNDNSWIFTTFGPLLDGCISICLEAMQIYESDSLIEEVLAVINSCLLSDSGALAVTGLRRLHKFITTDLSTDLISDDTWAVVCHMLRRCLTIRGLGSVLKAVERRNLAVQEEKDAQEEDEILINEFIMEEKMYSGKRFIGCNAAMVIGTLLCDSKLSECIGKRWYIFLLKGLTIGIKDWEGAAKVVGFEVDKSEDSTSCP